MQIIKRNGTTESYHREKIAIAMHKSFASTGKEITDDAIYRMVDEVEQLLHNDVANRSVERIQDEVERTLMEHGFYAEAKNYILYRWQRTERRKALNHIIAGIGDDMAMDILNVPRHCPSSGHTRKARPVACTQPKLQLQARLYL